MYTRSYFQDDEKINIPENYDGNAFIDESGGDAEIHTGFFPPPQHKECQSSERSESKKSDTGSGFIANLSAKLLPEGLWDKCSPIMDNLFGFGREEMLIIGISLFLIFSESRDVECAIILLLLLFIK